MADYYTQSSSSIYIPEGKDGIAQQVIDRLREENEYLGYSAVIEDGSVWIYEEEAFDPDHAEILVRALVEEMGSDKMEVVSWAHTCSKPRVDSFGGGAFAVRRGYETVWIDARDEVFKKAQEARPLCQPS